MEFKREDRIVHPAPVVLDVMIERLEEIVPFLPTVERIETLERETLPGGRERIVRRWHASLTNVPAAVRAFFSPDWLAWIDTAVWTPAEFTVDWSLSTKFGRLYDCSGTNSFEPDPKAPEERTRIVIAGNLTVYPDRVPGIPRFLRSRLAPTVERFVVDLITPNLTSVAQGLNRYLSQR